MNVYNLTENNAVITTKNQQYSVPPSNIRYDIPHPKSFMTNIGFVDDVLLFVPLGELPNFNWNDVVIVTPEQFAMFKIPCEVWIASGFDGKQYTRMCRVQPPVDPSTIKPPMDYDEASNIVHNAISAAANSHKLNQPAVAFIQQKLNEGSNGKLVTHTINLANDPKKLKEIINSALGEMGYIFH